ncbi:serine protease HtrA [Alkaliphilus transvaalensis]|uniref:serine protease HtrA n=1 Tax=Alkaliphilus transvaalensis TaxID=114628 RepID=UPI000A67D6FD|nr:trypsin-like peptidase domain-containing protein [Alkaliphilus transvaalensis]
MNYDNNNEYQEINDPQENTPMVEGVDQRMDQDMKMEARPSTYFDQERKLKPKKTSKVSYFILILVGALLGSTITMAATYTYLPQIIQQRGIYVGSGEGQPFVIEPVQDLTVYSAVARKAMSSVVGITTITLQRDAFFGTTRRTPSLGTGVIVDARGYILTNSHVVGDGNVEEIGVILYDGEQLPAEVVWQDRSLDLAVIKVDAANLPVAELGDSDLLEVGEIAVAIGNPLGLNFERTLTQGVISGLNRSIPLDGQETIENLIQTDASINPGNSGGPLLNARGQVIGINTAKIRSGEGLGFAIPINTAKPIVEQIIEQGEFTRVHLGIRGVNVDAFEATTGTKLQAEYGIYVVEIVADSPAEVFGMLPGDVITKIGEITVKTMGGLQRELYRYRPGDRIDVTVIRNGREEVINIQFE